MQALPKTLSGSGGFAMPKDIAGKVDVDASRPRDPRSCQGDARFQPMMISGSVNPAKDVQTGCPDTPSDSFVSHGPQDQSVALFLS